MGWRLIHEDEGEGAPWSDAYLVWCGDKRSLRSQRHKRLTTKGRALLGEGWWSLVLGRKGVGSPAYWLKKARREGVPRRKWKPLALAIKQAAKAQKPAPSAFVVARRAYIAAVDRACTLERRHWANLGARTKPMCKRWCRFLLALGAQRAAFKALNEAERAQEGGAK